MLEKIKELIVNKNVVVLTGAGVSVGSGISTFRGGNGLWNNHRIVDVAHPNGFTRDPLFVWSFYNERRLEISNTRPNKTHVGIKRLEDSAKSVTVITQNIDGLHQNVGSNTIPVHGDIHTVKCMQCSYTDRQLGPLGSQPLKKEDIQCPECGDLLRPDVVWFTEPLDMDVWMKGVEAIQQCDVFIIAGTSLEVSPVNELPPYAKVNGADIVEINPNPTNVRNTIAGVIVLPITSDEAFTQLTQ